MPGEWMDIRTNVKTDYYPATPPGQQSNIIWVETPSSPNPPPVRPYTGPQTEFEKRLDHLTIKTIKWTLIIVVSVAAVGYAGIEAYRTFNQHWDAKSSSGPLVYSSAELAFHSALAAWHHHEPIFLPGHVVVVDADISGKTLFSYADMVVKGDISNSNVSSTTGTLTVGNVENSTLKAHKIVITGIAKNTKQVIVPPDRVAPRSRVKRSAAR